MNTSNQTVNPFALFDMVANGEAEFDFSDMTAEEIAARDADDQARNEVAKIAREAELAAR
jgi:hypothetical protein